MFNIAHNLLVGGRIMLSLGPSYISQHFPMSSPWKVNEPSWVTTHPGSVLQQFEFDSAFDRPSEARMVNGAYPDSSPMADRVGSNDLVCFEHLFNLHYAKVW
jgi:hypothetical protein